MGYFPLVTGQIKLRMCCNGPIAPLCPLVNRKSLKLAIHALLKLVSVFRNRGMDAGQTLAHLSRCVESTGKADRERLERIFH